MPRKDPRVDAYIAKAQPFARPILEHIRAAVLSASSELEETLKWSHPAFMYHGIVCVMAGFKQHVTLGFAKSKLLLDPSGRPADEAWGQFGRLSAIEDLPPKRELVGYVKKAMKLNEDGVTVKREVTRSVSTICSLTSMRRSESTFAYAWTERLMPSCPRCSAPFT